MAYNAGDPQSTHQLYIPTMRQAIHLMASPMIAELDSSSAAADETENARNIVVLGETGAGKTAFISYLHNVCQDAKIEAFKDMSDPKTESGTQPRTNAPYLYTMKAGGGSQPTTINILDTPGLGAPKGISTDSIHIAQIVDTINNNMNTVDGVVILLNGSEGSLSTTCNYALEAILAILPQPLLDNVAIVYSKCDKDTLKFDVKSLPTKLQGTTSWTLQNPLAMWNDYEAALKAGKSTDKDLSKMKESAEKEYQNGLEFFGHFVQWLQARVSQPARGISDTSKKMSQVDDKIADAIAGYKEVQQKEKEVSQASDLVNADNGELTKAQVTQASFGLKETYEQLQAKLAADNKDLEAWKVQWATPNKALEDMEAQYNKNKDILDNGVIVDFVWARGRVPLSPEQRAPLEAEQAVIAANIKSAQDAHNQLEKRGPDLTQQISEGEKNIATARDKSLANQPPAGLTLEAANKAIEDAEAKKKKDETSKTLVENQLADAKASYQSRSPQILLLCSQYQRLAISRGYSYYIDSVKSLLAERYKAAQEHSTSPEELAKQKGILDEMDVKVKLAMEGDQRINVAGA